MSRSTKILCVKVSSLEITKARVRTAKKERRRSQAYRDKIMADREVKHHD